MGAKGRPAKRYSQAARLHDLIRLLESRGALSVAEMVEHTAVTRRTLYRDLAALEEAGYPLVKERCESGHSLYRFLTGFKKIPPIHFSLEELMTLRLCRSMLGSLEGTLFQEQLDGLLGRIHAVLPPRGAAHLERIAQAVSPRFLGTRDLSGYGERLALLQKALLYQYRCSLDYQPVGRSVQRYEFEPYTLLFYRDALYLAGYAPGRRDCRLFLLDRVLAVELTKERFEVPEDFSPAQLRGEAFGLVDEAPMDIRLRFAAPVAHLIRERRWHSRQSLQEGSGGSLLLGFRAGGMTEILAWLYSFLPHVEVLAPQELRIAYAEGLRRGLSLAENSDEGVRP